MMVKEAAKHGVTWYLYVAGVCGLGFGLWWVATQPPALNVSQDYLYEQQQKIERQIEELETMVGVSR